MALIECAECKHQVSDKAASCPKCGAPVTVSIEATEGRICGHCRTLNDKDAIACKSCGARYGYRTPGAKHTTALILWGGMFFLGLLMMNGDIGWKVAGGICLLFSSLALLKVLGELAGGKKWWR